MTSKTGIYPGTFDPITKGHFDLIERSLLLVDELIIAVAGDSASNKKPLFTNEERVKIVKTEIDGLEGNIKVIPLEGLLVDFAKKYNASKIIRGLRAVSDFEFEMQMAFMNKRLADDIVTVFLPAAEETQFISSRMVKEIARMGGDISSFVSEKLAPMENVRGTTTHFLLKK